MAFPVGLSLESTVKRQTLVSPVSRYLSDYLLYLQWLVPFPLANLVLRWDQKYHPWIRSWLKQGFSFLLLSAFVLLVVVHLIPSVMRSSPPIIRRTP